MEKGSPEAITKMAQLRALQGRGRARRWAYPVGLFFAVFGGVIIAAVIVAVDARRKAKPRGIARLLRIEPATEPQKATARAV